MIQAVLFDMDGVLVDSELQWRRAEEWLFREIGLDAGDADSERLVGLGVRDLHNLLVKECRLKTSWERFSELSDRAAEDVYLRRVTLADGALKLIEALRRRKLKVGLASGSPRKWIRMALDRFQLHPHFDAVVSVDDVGGEGKPSPAVYLRAAGRLRAEPRRCVAIEDSAYGVLAAKRAGMLCIGLRNGSNAGQDLNLADAEARGFTDLTCGAIAGQI